MRSVFTVRLSPSFLINNQRSVVCVTFGLVGFNLREDLPEGEHHGKQAGSDFLIEPKLFVAQQAIDQPLRWSPSICGDRLETKWVAGLGGIVWGEIRL